MWEWDSRVRWLAAVIIAVIIFGVGMQYGRWQESKESGRPILTERDNKPDFIIQEKTGEEGLNENEGAVIQVHVAGAVKYPGVYKLLAGARVNDAIMLAELLPEASPHSLNLATALSDGQQIIVPRKGEEVFTCNIDGEGHPSGVSGITHSQSGGKININSAALAELENLPGIGPVLARRIIDYRNQNGPFRTIEDLQNVSGIGAKKYSDIKDMITVK